jgi:DNA-binding CsgD family transcriptional regulator
VHLSNARSAQSARVALDAAGRHLLAVKASGAIHWSTPQAIRLINAATNSDDGLDIVSRRISTWMDERDKPGFARDAAFALVQNGQASLQFSFLGAIGADEHLFRLTAANKRPDDEVLRQHFPLTQRESEVLLWIAKGKSNRDIADILGLSARTVNKHLEQIYVKLGVENRASAAVKAAHVLHEM